MRNAFEDPISIVRLEWQQENTIYASTKTHWININVDSNGFIWLERPNSIGVRTMDTRVHEFYILNPEGEFESRTIV